MNPNLFLAGVAERGIANETECQELLSRYQGDGFAVLLYLTRIHPRHRDELGRLWGTSLGVAYVNPARTLIQYDLVAKLPEAVAREHKLLPLYELGSAVTVAMPDPTNSAVLSQVENYFDGFVSPVFAFPDQVDAELEVAYQTDTGIEQLLGDQVGPLRHRSAPISAAALHKLSRSDAVVRFTRGLILLAIKRRASDIHIEPGQRALRVRFRIDGVLQDAMTLDSDLLPPIVTRLKVMAQADIADTRHAQDGRISLEMADRTLDVRFSAIPTIYGEKVVLRLLGYTRFADIPDLVELDFCRTVFRDVERVLKSPNGIFFVTGPTGAGKTTTLCALLKHINNPGVNIVTIEDPVEYTVEGINQVQLNEAAGMTFADTLRFLLRQDPDILLVGEIRDGETATVATRAALTGHLVLTTLHTNNALQAVTRMLDLGVDPSLLAPSVVGSMAQRLVRRVCEACKEAYEPDDEEMNRFFEWDGRTRVRVYRAKGCSRCAYTGYYGRMAVHEIVIVSDAMRRLVARGADYAELEAVAARDGFRGLRYDALKKVLLGLTTFDEVVRLAAE